jgi:ribosomal protein S18 acetylase RimI-like enzyme
MLLNNDIKIRNYLKSDREVVRRISCDTAFLGEPAEIFFEGRDFIADFLTAYYTDYEPLSCFIAEVDSNIAGYLIGTTDESKMLKTLIFKILPKSFFKSFFKCIFFKKKNILFLFWNIYSFFNGQFFPKIDLKDYPALLHINFSSEYRGRGFGAKLLKEYLDYLNSEKVPGLHLTTHSEKAGRFFEKNNFKLLLKTKRSYYRGVINKDIGYYYYGILLK